MKAMLWLCGTVLKPVGHVYLFCLALPFGKLYLPLLKESEKERIGHEDGEQDYRKGRLRWVLCLR